MARRILPADSALLPNAQSSLTQGGNGTNGGVRGESRGGVLPWLQERWQALLNLRPGDLLFDWDDRSALMNEIAFVNQTRERIDEAALKLAPSMLRIVMTVKANIAEPKEQRAFLAEHVDWDLRRISELCIVADSYGLLDPQRRDAGAREIARYGWSCALKLAYVRDGVERADVWDRARDMKPKASYRAVLEEIRRLRERKLIGPPASESDVRTRWSAAYESFLALTERARDLSGPVQMQEALAQLSQAQRELGRLKRALQERIQATETEELAASA